MAKMGMGKGARGGGVQGSQRMPSVAAGVRAGMGAGVGAKVKAKAPQAMPGVTSPAYNKGLGRMAKAGKLGAAMGVKKPKGM
jgi:hypothetical protein